jgi:hypothetical protein
MLLHRACTFATENFTTSPLRIKGAAEKAKTKGYQGYHFTTRFPIFSNSAIQRLATKGQVALQCGGVLGDPF